MSNNDCKKPQTDHLKEEIAEATETIDMLTTLKHLYNKDKKYKAIRKDLIHKCKQLIASNTKKLKQIDKDYKDCLKKQSKTKKARCPNGTRKNTKTGKCEKK